MPAGGGSSPAHSGGIGHHACRHHDRHARCIAVTGAGAGGIPPPSIGAGLREAWSEAESLGCVSPLDKSRGGTPEVVRAPTGPAPQPARLRRLRNSVLRRSASFFACLGLPQLDHDGAGKDHRRLGLTKVETRSLTQSKTRASKNRAARTGFLCLRRPVAPPNSPR
jgi:hypothetical protein